jgi:hypothetical protein
MHVTMKTGGGGKGQRSVHIYIGGIGTEKTAYENVVVTGESVFKKTKQGRILNKELSKGMDLGVEDE